MGRSRQELLYVDRKSYRKNSRDQPSGPAAGSIDRDARSQRVCAQADLICGPSETELVEALTSIQVFG